MSEKNVELVREFFAASNRGDAAAALAKLDPEVVWDSTRLPVELPQRSFRGHAGWREFWLEVYEVLADVRYDVQEFLDAGDMVLAVAIASARGRTSGAPAEYRQYLVYKIENEKIMSMCVYEDRSEALSAAGL